MIEMRDVGVPAVEEVWEQEGSLPAFQGTLALLVIPEQEQG